MVILYVMHLVSPFLVSYVGRCGVRIKPLDSRSREAVFESSCLSSVSCINDYLAIDSGG